MNGEADSWRREIGGLISGILVTYSCNVCEGDNCPTDCRDRKTPDNRACWSVFDLSKPALSNDNLKR